MDPRTNHSENSRPSIAAPIRGTHAKESCRSDKKEMDLRSRLLELIMKNEQNRKTQAGSNLPSHQGRRHTP